MSTACGGVEGGHTQLFPCFLGDCCRGQGVFVVDGWLWWFYSALVGWDPPSSRASQCGAHTHVCAPFICVKVVASSCLQGSWQLPVVLAGVCVSRSTAAGHRQRCNPIPGVLLFWW